MQDLYYRREEWVNLKGKELEDFKQGIIRFFREKGFPYHRMEIDEQIHQMEVMDRYCSKTSVIEEITIKQTMHCLGVAWSYFPHHWDIRCGKSKTAMEVFEDDKLLLKAIEKRMKSGTHINIAMMRKTFKVAGGAQVVSNFRPSASRALYDVFAGEGNVWDMSAGFGGRLLGALSSKKVKQYIGTEPSRKTFDGLMKMTDNLASEFNTDVILDNIGSEDFEPEPDSLDLCLTSPPYFDNEKYADEPTQSYIKYPTKEKWLNDFMGKTLENCKTGLKKDGTLIINIADVKSYPHLASDFLILAENKGFELIGRMKLALSKAHSGGKFKYEPIFVFKRS